MMRTHTIQINDYFARKAAELPTSSRLSDLALGRWLAQARDDKSLPSKQAQDELRAAWQLGVVKDLASSANGYEWSIDGSRLAYLADGAEAQAAEQLAAILAVAAELLGSRAYLMRLESDSDLAQYVEAYSTTYNAHLARVLGASLVETDDDPIVRKPVGDVILATIWQNAQTLIKQHGLRRHARVVINEQKETSMKKNPVVPATEAVPVMNSESHLTVWRFAQANEVYRLEWLVEVTAGVPTRLICAFAQGNEPQRAVIETAVALLNRALAIHGAEEVARLALAADGGFFGKEMPLTDFAAAFAETFLSKQQREKLMVTSTAQEQIDLLQTIEAVHCERCHNPVEQFGEYAICMNCGDAQFVR